MQQHIKVIHLLFRNSQRQVKTYARELNVLGCGSSSSVWHNSMVWCPHWIANSLSKDLAIRYVELANMLSLIRTFQFNRTFDVLTPLSFCVHEANALAVLAGMFIHWLLCDDKQINVRAIGFVFLFLLCLYCLNLLGAVEGLRKSKQDLATFLRWMERILSFLLFSTICYPIRRICLHKQWKWIS